ncbi:MAG: DUF4129 domain-containing protein, partial [Pirellula sp.]
LVIYLSSALALLVMISLLSLRQYVRQRDVEMETGMSWSWLASGIGSVLGLVALMAILPLPMLGSSSWELPFKISSRPDLTPSKWGWGNEGVKQQPQPQQPQQQQPQPHQPQPHQPQQQQPQQQQPQSQQPQPQQPQQQQPQPQQLEQQQPQQPPQPPTIDWNLGATLRWLIIAVLVLTAVVFGLKYFRQWLAWFQQDKVTESEESTNSGGGHAEQSRLFRFSELDDPFKIHRNDPDAIIRSLFQAVLVWGSEHRVAKAEDETPDEYTRRLGRKYSEVAESLVKLGLMVSRLAYAKRSISVTDAQSLYPLWEWMRSESKQQ